VESDAGPPRTAAALPGDGRSPLHRAACEARDGDARAIERLVELARPVMLRVAARRLRCPADAEDAVQNALLALLVMIRRYDPSRDPVALLTVLSLRKSVDLLRRNRPRDRVGIDCIPAEPALAPRAEELLFAREIWDRIQTLPTAQRDAMMLTQARGLSLTEAAAASGRSTGALKVAVHRARGRLAAGA